MFDSVRNMYSAEARSSDGNPGSNGLSGRRRNGSSNGGSNGSSNVNVNNVNIITTTTATTTSDTNNLVRGQLFNMALTMVSHQINKNEMRSLL